MSLSLRRVLSYFSAPQLPSSDRLVALLSECVQTESANGSIPSSSSHSRADTVLLNDLRTLSVGDLGPWVTSSVFQRWHETTSAAAGSSFNVEPYLLFPHHLEGRNPAEFSKWSAALEDTIACCTLLQTRNVSVCVFVIPPGKSIDLHDHPSMVVWQSCLVGTMNVLAFDWSERSAPCLSDARFARLVTRSALRAGCSGVITPTSGGVVHQVTCPAGTSQPAVFIDIISPPYNTPPQNLQCTYYRCKTTVQEVGDQVELVPRRDFYGPPMNCFVPVTLE